MDLALADLDTAVQLSRGCGRAAEQAYTQRGLVWRLRGEDERVLEDFKSAARLGSHFAERQVGQVDSHQDCWGWGGGGLEDGCTKAS